MRKRTKTLLVITLAAVLVWPVGFYGRTYPAFGGESLAIIAALAALVADLVTGKEQED